MHTGLHLPVSTSEGTGLVCESCPAVSGSEMACVSLLEKISKSESEGKRGSLISGTLTLFEEVKEVLLIV